MIGVLPASQRFHTEMGWLESWHSFSFAEHCQTAWGFARCA